MPSIAQAARHLAAALPSRILCVRAHGLDLCHNSINDVTLCGWRSITVSRAIFTRHPGIERDRATLRKSPIVGVSRSTQVQMRATVRTCYEFARSSGNPWWAWPLTKTAGTGNSASGCDAVSDQTHSASGSHGAFSHGGGHAQHPAR